MFAVSEKFDALYEKETTLYGDTYKTAYQNDDINSDGLISPEEKISILILDIFDDASSVQSSGVLGYFWAKDFYPDSSTSKSGIRSNETEIFYIESLDTDELTADVSGEEMSDVSEGETPGEAVFTSTTFPLTGI